jgi:hypothetical protein
MGLFLLGCRTEVPREKASRPTAEKQPAEQKLPDGLYKVLREGPQKKDVLAVGRDEIVVVNDHRYASKGSAPPPQYLAVRLVPDVPLVLASAPKVVKDDSGLMRIEIQLAREHADAMEQFTRKNKGGQTAVIIAGGVVTVHKIRAAITGGRCQVTCCAEGACDYLLKHLRDKVAKGQ